MTVMDRPKVAPGEKLFAAAIRDIGFLPRLACAWSSIDNTSGQIHPIYHPHGGRKLLPRSARQVSLIDAISIDSIHICGRLTR